MKNVILSILLMLLPVLASADAVEIDGVWYNLIPKVQVAEVTSKPSGNYTGDITIPDKLTYDNVEYGVTKILDYTFYKCGNLHSVTIGNNVTSIGESAFRYCGLNSVHISDIKAWCEIEASISSLCGLS